MQTKRSGVSLLVAVGVSFLIAAIAISVLHAIIRSLNESVDIEQSNQAFLSMESGLEAAFYHHNARGQGVDFEDDTNTAQQIAHSAVGFPPVWTIDGRVTEMTDGKYQYSGILGEFEAIEIPLFWDGSDGPDDVPSSSDTSATSFTVNFSVSNPPTALLDNVFDFLTKDGTEDNNEVLIDWNISKNASDGTRLTFLPTTHEGDDICSGVHMFLCDDAFDDAWSGLIQANISSGDMGRILPGGAEVSLSDFLTTNISSTPDIKLIFRSLLAYEDSDSGEQIPGIEYTLELSGGTPPHDIPKPTYTASAKISEQDFEKELTVQVKERTSVGVFDYVVVD